MKNKYYTQKRILVILFFGILSFIFNSSFIFANYSPEPEFTLNGYADMDGDGGWDVNSYYDFKLVSHDSIKNEAKYTVTSHYWFTINSTLYSDELWINEDYIGTFDSKNGKYDADESVYRDEVFTVTLRSGVNIVETKNVDGVGGNDRKQIRVKPFATPPTVSGTNGTWYAGEVASGLRTRESLYTDGATGSSANNKVQTSTGFMYSDIDEQKIPVNAYSDTTLGRNSSITGIRNVNTGEEYSIWNFSPLNNVGTYLITSCTEDSGGLEGCGNRYINVIAKHQLSFNTNGGTYVAPQTIIHGNKATRPSNPTKSGSVFINWYTDSSLNTPYDFNTTITTDKTIYAKWDVKPSISANNKTFYEGQYTSAQWRDSIRWQGVSATDKEDGNITSRITVTADNVNVNKAGTYNVTYYVTDSVGNATSKSVTVTVLYNNPPTVSANNQTFYEGQYTSAQWRDTLRWQGVSATDKEDGNITSKVTIKSDNTNVNLYGTYNVVYTVTDSFGKSADKKVTITVKYNNPPTIKSEDRWFYVTDDVNTTKLMERVRAQDKEDGNITSKAVISSNNVKNHVIGDYQVTYKVTDKYGKSATSTSTIHIVTDIPTGTDRTQYLRFISKPYINTLKPTSIWRTGVYSDLLQATLNKTNVSQAKEHWVLTAADVQRIKDFNATHDWSTTSNQDFLTQFGNLKR